LYKKTPPQVHDVDIPVAVPAVLRRDVLAVPVAADAVAHRGGQGAGVHAADHVPGVGIGTAGARAAVRPRGGDTRGVRAPAHRVPVVRVPRAPGPVLFRHVRDAHPTGQALGAGQQRRQPARVARVPGARLDRHVPGRLPVRLAHRIRNYTVDDATITNNARDGRMKPERFGTDVNVAALGNRLYLSPTRA